MFDPRAATRESLRQTQTAGLRQLLAILAARSSFYRTKIDFFSIEPASFELGGLASLPLTTKAELVSDQVEHPPYGSLATENIDQYVRIHRTSGTTGRPLRWLDTQVGWAAFLDCWSMVFRAAAVTAADRVFVAFSFGPFIGFWGAFEAAQQLGALTVSGGSQTTVQRLDAILEEQATVLVSTPTYALHLAEVAHQRGIDLAGSSLTKLIQAGEPGASVPSIHRTLRESFGARVFDHAGATEVGAWGFPATYPGAAFGEMCINDEHFIAEVIDPDTTQIAAPDSDGARSGELVLTSFTRAGCSLLRYRTGDSVQMLPPDAACPYHRLVGGVRGRIDDMFVVRGVNVFPSAVENVVFAVPGVAEFLATVVRTKGLSEIEIEIEPNGHAFDPAEPGSGGQHGHGELAGAATSLPKQVADRLQNELSLRVHVRLAQQPLPRYELKAHRFRFDDPKR